MANSLLCGLGGAILAISAVAAQAQSTSENRVASERAWSVFVDNDPTECWVVSVPTETVNTRGGRQVAVNRSEIQMFVSYRPASNVAGEVSFTGGYPFAENSTVQLAIGDSSFDLFTTGENAWAATTADDRSIATAMKRGTEAVITGRSSRGTTTRDTFSLFGFTAALEEAESRCTN
ncbi:invasion associated locus B family protein [Cochlodiniinecator piscidefendens]|uniref:invasion associated locus B family protein n=1 Tax=Cochlodiniinecator piscidefendens TaxID=2715756 RepID=UPI00197B51E7|nr:invasion associated locus B family protein [Cochlodiniinecator piscidefendens]